MFFSRELNSHRPPVQIQPCWHSLHMIGAGRGRPLPRYITTYSIQYNRYSEMTPPSRRDFLRRLRTQGPHTHNHHEGLHLG